MTPAGSHRPFFSSSTLLPLVSVVLLLVVGFVVADDYGMSWDEERNYPVGADALQAYTSPGQFLDYLDAGDPLAQNGPAYFMPWAVLTKVWMVVPLVALIGLGMGIYGNIRHLHFVLVPVMILAGIGMAWAMGRLRRIGVEYALYTLVVLPGVIGIVHLHPYESVYFNSYVGGVRGRPESMRGIGCARLIGRRWSSSTA